jgi:hypothetical protein
MRRRNSPRPTAYGGHEPTMSRTDLKEDGAVAVAVLTTPRRGLDLAVTRRRSLVAILIATAASLLFAAIAVPRLDFEKAASKRLETGPEAAEMTPFQREEAVEQARKVGSIAVYAGSAFSPALSVLVAAFFLWLGFKVAGTSPPFKGTLAVAAHGLLPTLLAPILMLPAIFMKAPIDPEALTRLLPSSLAAFLPEQASPVALAAAASFDLFSFWSLALVAMGMARLSGASPRRATAVTVVLWLAFVGLLRIAPAAALAAARSHGGGA